MTLAAITNLSISRSADGTYAGSWSADVPADAYFVTVNGTLVQTVTGPSFSGVVANPGDVIAVQAEALSPSDPYTVPQPPPVLKTRIKGYLDRGGVPSLAPSIVGAYVVDHPISAFWSGSGGLIHPNPLDTALAQTSYLVKLRADKAGNAPQSMLTVGGFHPMTVTDPNSGASVAIGPYFTPAYLAMYEEYVNLMAAEYDSAPNLREVVMALPADVYSEPFLPHATAGVPGWTLTLFEACFASMYTAHKAWKTTLQDLAFNPFTLDQPFTEAQITAVRHAFLLQAVLGNNSLRDSDMGTEYDAMYAAIAAAGGPIYFQTAGSQHITSLDAVLAKAVALKASSVELPGGYSTQQPTLLKYLSALQAAA